MAAREKVSEQTTGENGDGAGAALEPVRLEAPATPQSRPSQAGAALEPVRLEARHVGLELDGARILTDVSCEIDVRRLAIIGPNGSGKSTFLRLIDGLATPTEGEIRVLGIDPAEEPRRVHDAVGFVFTNPDSQIIMPTAAEDVAFSLKNVRREGRRLSKEESDRRVAAALERFGLEDVADVPAHSLSGGQKQLLSLAAALVREPALVLADEPTTMLDLPNARRIERELTEGLGVPLIVATHDLDLAARCDLALRFDGGRIAEVGEPDRVIARYRALYE